MWSDTVTVSFKGAEGTRCAGQEWVVRGRKEARSTREEALPTAQETAGACSRVPVERRCSWGVQDNLVPGIKSRGARGQEEELGGGGEAREFEEWTGSAGARILLSTKVGLRLGAQEGQETQTRNFLLEKTTQPCRRVLPAAHASSLAGVSPFLLPWPVLSSVPQKGGAQTASSLSQISSNPLTYHR